MLSWANSPAFLISKKVMHSNNLAWNIKYFIIINNTPLSGTIGDRD